MRPYDFVRAAYRAALDAKPYSVERARVATRRAFEVAVGSGMGFAPGDFGEMMRDFGHYLVLGAADRLYALAVVSQSGSAARSIEAWAGHPPFLAERVDVSPTSGIADRYLHSAGERRRERLAVGFRFPWDGENFAVTSIHGTNSIRLRPGDEEPYVVAATYARDEPNLCPSCRRSLGGDPLKIARRVRLTAADLRAARKAAP